MKREYGPGEKQIIVWALKHAKKNLWDGSGRNPNQFVSICSALPDTFGAILVKELIAERLEGYFGVRSWLIRKGHVGREYSFGFDLEIQQYRHAWVDSLIEEFSK